MNIEEHLEKFGIELSEEQKSAVHSHKNKLLVLAVPGAGKTTVMVSHLAGLIFNDNVDPKRILALTYNKAAARDMLLRWNKLFGQQLSPKFSTIHSFCYGLLGEYSLFKGNPMPRLITDDTDKRRIIIECCKNEKCGYLQEDDLDRAVSALSYAVNMMLSMDEAEKHFKDRMPYFRPAMEAYTSFKRKNGLMDFDDMQSFAYLAMKRYPAFYEKIKNRYDFVLVDEVQDTSLVQQEIINLIANNSLYMVGDEDQSIYGFRGSYPEGLLNYFSGDDTDILKLSINYRSTPEIVTAAETLIKKNKSRIDKNMKAVRDSGAKIELVTDINFTDQYESAVDRAISLRKNGESVAILYRGGVSGLALTHIIKNKTLNFSVSDSRYSFAGDFIVRDIFNIAAFAEDRTNKEIFKDIYYKMGAPISKLSMMRAVSEGSGNLITWIVDNERYESKNSGKLLYLNRMLDVLSGKSPERAVNIILNELEYLKYILKRSAAGYAGNASLQKLSYLLMLAKESSSFSDLKAKLSEPIPETKGGIRLSTVHSAKGQEFDHVIIVDAVEGIFPSYTEIDDSLEGDLRGIEEETRLFYTAVTRAKKTLTVYAPNNAFDEELLISRFAGYLGLKDCGDGAFGLRTGLTVSHVFFGIGRIENIDRKREIVSVQFGKYGLKDFRVNTLTDEKYFKIIE